VPLSTVLRSNMKKLPDRLPMCNKRIHSAGIPFVPWRLARAVHNSHVVGLGVAPPF
jgi:hypothetical protein